MLSRRGLRNCKQSLLITVRRAQCEGVSRKSNGAGANRIAILRDTLRPQSAGIRARVGAFLIYARQMRRTLGVNDAFRPARWWDASVLWQTGAHGLAVDHSAFTVGPAGRREARFHRVF